MRVGEVARSVGGGRHRSGLALGTLFLGAFAGGWAADRGATTTLVACNAVLALAALYVVGSAPIPVALALGVWGLVGFGLVPSLQYRAVGLAGAERDLAATLPASAVNAGIAFGALAGGLGRGEPRRFRRRLGGDGDLLGRSARDVGDAVLRDPDVAPQSASNGTRGIPNGGS